jgi:hypothetical protein
MDQAGRRRAVQLHADLERLVRAKTHFLRGMSLLAYTQLLADGNDQHSGDPVLLEAAKRAHEASEADSSDPLAPMVETQEALVVVGQLIALPLLP